MNNYVIVMKFPNGNIVTKHFLAESESAALGVARRQYPELIEYHCSGSWGEEDFERTFNATRKKEDYE